MTTTAQNGGTWKVIPAFNKANPKITAPACVAAPVTRDNHLGNDATGNEVFANFTIPLGARAHLLPTLRPPLKVHTEIGQNFQHFCLITKSHRHAIILTSAKFRHPLVRVSTTNLIIKLRSLEERQHTTAYLLSFHYYIVYICIATLIPCSRNHDTFVLPVNTDH